MKPLGQYWLDGFLFRNPEAKTLRGKGLDFNLQVALRLTPFRNSLPSSKYQPSSKFVKRIVTIRTNQACNRGPREWPSTRIANDESGDEEAIWVTLLEYNRGVISATGRLLEPLVISEGKNVQQQRFPSKLQKYQNWRFQASSWGWMNNEIALNWLKTIFFASDKARGQ